MARPITTPQEIIDEIISYLADDYPTLHDCSRVSYSFYFASRKHIFSTVRLHTPSAARGLNSLLDESPNTATLITTLHVYILPHERRSTLPAVLPRLSYVENLVIGHEEHIGNMHWRALPHKIKHSLETLIGSPSLHSLTFSSTFYLPISILSFAEHVRVLKLCSVAFIEPDAAVPMITSPTPTPIPIQLESIHCSSSITNPLQSHLSLYAPHLRHFTIVGNSTDNILTIQKICATVTPTCAIENFTWLEYRGDDPYINPGILARTRRLTFVTWTFNIHWRPRFAPMWDSLLKLLNDASLETLEEFSFTLRCTSDIFFHLDSHITNIYFDIDEFTLGAPHGWWSRLDAYLGDPSCTPKLRVANINVEIVENRTNPTVTNNSKFSSVIKNHLPLLRDRGMGMLSTRLIHSGAVQLWF